MSNPGFFSKDGTAYIVTEPYTAIPFTNVLYNEDGYLTELTQWGTGASSVQFADKETCTILLEGGKALYLRNEKTGKVWCPGIEPMHSAVEKFTCEHGDGYTTVSSEFEGISVRFRTFVPAKGLREVWTVEITNHNNIATELSVVPMVKMELMGYTGPRFCNSPLQSYVTTFEEELNGTYFETRNPNTKGKPYDAVLAASGKVDFYSGCDRATLAAPQTLYYPYALLNGKNLDSSVSMSGIPFMALQCIASIEPEETKRMDFVLGTCCNKEEAKEIVSVLSSETAVEAEFEKALAKIDKRRKRVRIKTPDDKINYFVNTWLKKGMEYCLRKKDATRDNLQFAFGLTMSEPEVTKDTIRLAMSYQYKDGHTVRSWLPLDETYYSDGPLWIVLVTCDYLKYTSDVDFLKEKVPYFDGGEATVLDHLQSGIERLCTDKGPHNLCLARWADWNDALNLDDPNAESVFVSMGLAWCLKEMSVLMKYIGMDMLADKYTTSYEELKEIINQNCWDEKGEYYVRGFSHGKVIGGTESEGSTIYANPQTWAVLSGVVTAERVEKIVAATDKYIVTDLGCLVNYPAYAEAMPEIGRISYQYPGTVENGAVYCHATAFKINADVMRGDGERAYRELKKIMPDSETTPYEVSGALPYTLTSCYATNEHIWGKTGRPWLTGSQGWMIRCVVEGFLGIQKAYGGFYVTPAMPDDWNEAECMIERNGTEYVFTIKRTGVESITVDGVMQKQSFVAFSEKERVCVDITM